MLEHFFADKQFPNDSLEMIDLIIDIEDTFDITITMTEASEIKNMHQLMKLVEGKIDVV